MNKFKRFGERLDFPQILALELRIVKVVEVVECPDRVAVAQQMLTDMGADEARAAGDQKIHARTLTIRGRAVECAGNLAGYLELDVLTSNISFNRGLTQNN